MYQGESVVLTPFEEHDIETYRQWVNDPLVMSQLDRTDPVTAFEHLQWYRSIVQNPQTVIFAMRYQEDFLGCIWLHNIHQRHRHAEVRVLLGSRKHQNKGLGLDAIKTLAGVAFECLNLNKIYAFVLETNPRAKACFCRAGFSEEGFSKEACYNQGKYIGVHHLGLLKAEYQE